MFDTTFCRTLTLGPPAVVASALVELHRFLQTARNGVGGSGSPENTDAQPFQTTDPDLPAPSASNIPNARTRKSGRVGPTPGGTALIGDANGGAQ